MKRIHVKAGVFVAFWMIVLAYNVLTAPDDVPKPPKRKLTVKNVAIGTGVVALGAFALFPATTCAWTGVCMVGAAAAAPGTVATAATVAKTGLAWAAMETISQVRSNTLTPCTLPIVWGDWPVAVCHDRDRGFVALMPKFRLTNYVCPTVKETNLMHVVDLLLLRSDLGFACMTTPNGLMLKMGYLFIASLTALGTCLWKM